MRPLIKLILFWLGMNLIAGLLTGLFFAPFKNHANWEEHAVFLGNILLGAGLLYFASFELNLTPANLLQVFYSGTNKAIRTSLKYFFAYIGLFLLIVLVLLGIFLTLDYLVNVPGGHAQFLHAKDVLRHKALSTAAGGSTVFFILSSCLLAPIIEEIFYRRLLFTELRKRYILSVSIISSSIFFAFFHSNILISFIAGAYLAYTYEKEKDLVANTLLHAQINIFSILLMTAMQKLQPFLPQ